jgi:beta-phosphoglucomutase-like phosphatase (HAD superfamily)
MAFIFDLDGTLVDSVNQHVLAWREALATEGIELSVWNSNARAPTGRMRIRRISSGTSTT